MSLKGELETVIELKSSPEKFFGVWKTQAYHIPNHTPDNIHAVDMHEGEWETEGSIKIWRYSVGKCRQQLNVSMCSVYVSTTQKKTLRCCKEKIKHKGVVYIIYGPLCIYTQSPKWFYLLNFAIKIDSNMASYIIDSGQQIFDQNDP